MSPAAALRIDTGAAHLSVPVCIDAAIVRFVAQEARIAPVRFDQIEEVFAPWPATRADLVDLRRRLARLCADGWLRRSGPELRQRWTPGALPIPAAGPLPALPTPSIDPSTPARKG